jgi:NhaA family Na+:H+ antiporter
VLALLGPRVPVGLKALLLAIAIVDDIGAILVIAVFYAGDLDPTGFMVAGGALVGAVVLQRLGVWDIPVYVALGLIGWAGTLASGIHPTIIGVAFGLLTPWRALTAVESFSERARELLDRIKHSSSDAQSVEAHAEEVETLLVLSDLGREAVAPLDRLEHELHVVVAFVVVPAFAFVNAGVQVDADTLSDALSSSLTWAVFAGLVIGKPLGILAGIWLAVRVGAQLPRGVGWSEIVGLGMLAGIGFTVSLLITDLAFTVDDLETYSKLGIILASVASGTAGYLYLRRRLRTLAAPVAGGEA